MSLKEYDVNAKSPKLNFSFEINVAGNKPKNIR